MYPYRNPCAYYINDDSYFASDTRSLVTTAAVVVAVSLLLDLFFSMISPILPCKPLAHDDDDDEDDARAKTGVTRVCECECEWKQSWKHFSRSHMDFSLKQMHTSTTHTCTSITHIDIQFYWYTHTHTHKLIRIELWTRNSMTCPILSFSSTFFSLFLFLLLITSFFLSWLPHIHYRRSLYQTRAESSVLHDRCCTCTHTDTCTMFPDEFLLFSSFSSWIRCMTCYIRCTSTNSQQPPPAAAAAATTTATASLVEHVRQWSSQTETRRCCNRANYYTLSPSQCVCEWEYVDECEWSVFCFAVHLCVCVFEATKRDREWTNREKLTTATRNS